tara:strand:- start:405 stop:599 length:195 start_codon:yes stop_codon:yes gene_type:complete
MKMKRLARKMKLLGVERRKRGCTMMMKMTKEKKGMKLAWEKVYFVLMWKKVNWSWQHYELHSRE